MEVPRDPAATPAMEARDVTDTTDRDNRIRDAFRARRANGEPQAFIARELGRRFGLGHKKIMNIVNTPRQPAEKERASA